MIHRKHWSPLPALGLALALATLDSGVAAGQAMTGGPIPGVKTGGSTNMKVLSHIPMGANLTTADVDIEQELSRPYAYVARRMTPSGFDVISLKDPDNAKVMYSWRIENADLHQGAGSLNPMYLKSKGRYYLTTAYQFRQGGPDSDLGLIVHDITSLPDTSKVKELARIRLPEFPGGFHESFAYKHSNGQALIITTTTGPYAHAYDIDKVAAGDPNQGLVSKIPRPDTIPGMPFVGYHDMYVGYDPATHQDKFYGAGLIGFYVFDITNLAAPKLVTSITGAAGTFIAHTFTPDPTGRYAVTEMEYQYSPLRIFDLKPGLDGTVKTISRPVGAWMPAWDGLPHNTEVRWPYVFTSAYEDGLQVFNMMDPANPYTVGYYYTFDGPRPAGAAGAGRVGGAGGTWGIDIRNADGLIVASDMMTGFWAVKMDGFDGWNGHQWGMPNVSSAQDWDNGPDGAPRPTRVTLR